jgi:uncharacterized protein YacL (UPF0231 family)
MKKIIIVFTLIIVSFCDLYALVFPTAKTIMENNNINLGEIVKVKFEVTIPVFLDFLQDENRIKIDGWEIKDISFKRDFRVKGKYIVVADIVTYDSSVKQIPDVKFLCVNKDFDYEEIPFFSNAVAVNVNNIFSDDNTNNIRDIKSPKNLKIYKFIYLFISLFVLFVIVIIYRNLFLVKFNKVTRLLNSFSNKEIVIRELNRLLKNKELSQNDIRSYYFTISFMFRDFVLKSQNINIQMTIEEIIDILQKKDNLFFEHKEEIEELFKNYDYIKYSGKEVSYNDFIDILANTKNIIEKY